MIRHFLSLDWRVVIATDNDGLCHWFKSMGVHTEHVLFHRGRLSPRKDAHAYRAMGTICQKWQPDLIQQFHAKPVVLGSIAARRTLGESVRIVNTITGLGSILSAGRSRAMAAGLGFRAALRRGDTTVFQNPDDRALFVRKKWVAPESTTLITGSGVDIDRFKAVDRAGRHPAAPVVVMIARLLERKGIFEFASVARRIRQRWPRAKFLLAGECDPAHPNAIAKTWLRKQQDIEYVGHLPDIVPFLHDADLFLYPSLYREGVPRVVVEAAATALPAVAFDVPGVREAVQNNQTGLLVTARDLDAMTTAVADLIEDEDRRLSLGSAARVFAENTLDIRHIQKHYLDLYRSLGVVV
jgi:glycosyltransferase involved in cell wall biosynthesis